MNAVKFNNDIIAKKLEEKGVSGKKVSSVILERSSNYISSCLKRQLIGEKELKRLCMFLDVNYDDVLIIEPEIVEEKVEEVVKNNAVPDSTCIPDYNDKIDLLTVGINTLYEGQCETNNLLKELIQEIKVTNQKLERVEQKVNTIENAVGQTVSKSIMILDTQKNIETHLRDAKSTLAIIKGRTTDIKDEVCEKTSKKKYA